MLKLGTAAPWVTALASAERCPLEDPELDPEAVPAAVAGAELELELEEPEPLDEHAASSSPAAMIASADDTRLAREARGARSAPPPRLKPCRLLFNATSQMIARRQ